MFLLRFAHVSPKKKEKGYGSKQVFFKKKNLRNKERQITYDRLSLLVTSYHKVCSLVEEIRTIFDILLLIVEHVPKMKRTSES